MYFRCVSARNVSKHGIAICALRSREGADMNFCRIYNKIIKTIGLDEFDQVSEINIFTGIINVFMASALFLLSVFYIVLYFIYEYMCKKTTSRCDNK